MHTNKRALGKQASRKAAADEAKVKARQDSARFKWRHPGYMTLAEVIARSDKRLRSAITHPGKRR